MKTKLAAAAEDLLAAQAHYNAIVKYVDNLPDGPTDLGFAMQLAWCSASPEYKTVVYELHQRMKKRVRHELEVIKADAWLALELAESSMQLAAQEHRRA